MKRIGETSNEILVTEIIQTEEKSLILEASKPAGSKTKMCTWSLFSDSESSAFSKEEGGTLLGIEGGGMCFLCLFL